MNIAGILLLIGLSVATPLRVFAYTATLGVDNFFNGFLSTFSTPMHVLLIGALGLWYGHAAVPRLSYRMMGVFTGGLVVGLSGVSALAIRVMPEYVLMMWVCVVGVLIAWSPRLPVWVSPGVLFISGLCIGIDSSPGYVTFGTTVMAVLGIIAGVHVLLFDTVFYSRLLVGHRAHIAVRIIGSWIAAIGIMVCAYSIRQ